MKFSQTAALAAASLLTSVPTSQAISLRFLARRTTVRGDADFEVVTEKPFVAADQSDTCKCSADSFWNELTKACVKRGGVGYECGFFAAADHDDVCQDGLKCVKLDSSDVHYYHAGAVPASCQACKDGEACSRKKACGEGKGLSGESCVTIKATVSGGSEKESETETEKATATATASATYGEGERAVTKTATANYTAEATATAAAAVGAKDTGSASAEATSCVSLADVLAKLGLSEGSKVFSTDEAATVIKEGLAMASDLAKKEAEKAAKKKIGDVSEDKAEDKAEEQAEDEAKEKAKKLAEEGAQKTAQAKAEAEAKAAYEAQTTAAPQTTAEPETTTEAPTVPPPAVEVTGDLFPAPPAPITPAEEPTVAPRRKVPADDVAAALP